MEEKKKNWFVRHKIWTTIIILFVIGLIGSSSSSSPSNSQSNNKSTENMEVTPTSSENEINVSVRFNSQAFLVENKETVALKDCKLKMNSSGLFDEGFIYEIAEIPEADSIAIPFSEFTKKDGTRFNTYTQKAKNLSISCKNVGGQSGFNYFTL